ncbi:MAG: hypothetical protein LBQ48_06565, partial [Oscillospiraceae bacterium]|nr:hypothetical protein [Oscillospiraceae bacterium]
MHQTLCFWSWNGDLREAEIRRQVAGFEGKFGGLVIHARAGLSVPYLGEQWFAAYEAAAEEASRRGIDLWIYDEDGWPSGSAGGKLAKLDERHWIKKLKYGNVSDAGNHPLLAMFEKRGETDYRL